MAKAKKNGKRRKSPKWRHPMHYLHKAGFSKAQAEALLRHGAAQKYGDVLGHAKSDLAARRAARNEEAQEVEKPRTREVPLVSMTQDQLRNREWEERYEGMKEAFTILAHKTACG